jgi:hypothetical protein
VKRKRKNKNIFSPLLLFAVSATVLSLWLNLSWSVSAFYLGRAGNILYDASQGSEFLADLTLFNINRRHYRAYSRLLGSRK